VVTEGLKPIDEILQLAELKKSFVLQGGAGSGKTETLKQVIECLANNNSNNRVVCITHTNKAAEEIGSRVKVGLVSPTTIHSFLGSLIKPFKKNIQTVFPELFVLTEFVAKGAEVYSFDEKEQRKREHERFRKTHGRLEKLRFRVLGQETEKVIAKPQYDKDPTTHNHDLNKLIRDINIIIREQIKSRDVNNEKFFAYNETGFDSFNDSSFSHDGLIKVSWLLFDMYPMIGKMVSDRFDYIFIDEYQDTDADIIRVLLQKLPENSNTVIGLFGDSDQAIYSDGVGSVQNHIDSGDLVLIEKPDNFRCSPQVIEFANKFRTDSLNQAIELKRLNDGSSESLESRQGSVKLFYAIAPVKVAAGNATEDNKVHSIACSQALSELLQKVTLQNKGFVHLKLTNKSIANDAGFGKLLEIFSQRYQDPKEHLTKILDKLQFRQIIELIELYESLTSDKRAYNQLISMLKKRGFTISSIADKDRLQSLLVSLSSASERAYSVVEYAIKHNLIDQSESHKFFVSNGESFLKELDGDEAFKCFETMFNQGYTTLFRMLKQLNEAPNQELPKTNLQSDFEGLLRKLKKKIFYEKLFSKDLTFGEVLAFYRYESNDTNFMTMHKTKGTGIDDVLIVIDEYKWREYDFLSCFSGVPPASKRESVSRKLFYVACSRTKFNLICVRLMKDEEEARYISKFFPFSTEINIV
jgi:DNA helicase-2/ATP-dependent DNA helicase PcrA